MDETVQSVKKGWRLFARDKPGRRFVRHYRRSQQRRSLRKSVVRVAVGTILTAAGVLLWFLPAVLAVLFGLATFAAESRILARFLDSAEVAVRARVRRMRRWWRATSWA